MVSSALMLILVFALIGTLQFFTEPQILRPIANGTITPDFTPNIYAFNLAFPYAQFNYASAISFALGVVVFVGVATSSCSSPATKERTAVTTAVAAPAVAATRAAARSADQGGASPSTWSMVALIIYFLIPFWWLVVASTKDDDGAVLRRRRAVVRLAGLPLCRQPPAAVHLQRRQIPALAGQLRRLRRASAASAPPCWRCWPATASPSTASPAGTCCSPALLGSVMVPLDRAGHPDLHAADQRRPDRHHLGGHPAVAAQPVRRLPDAGLRPGVRAGRAAGRGPRRRGRRAARASCGSRCRCCGPRS